MATSGTYGATTIDQRTFIEQAASVAGLPKQALTREVLTDARLELYQMFSLWGARGINLWTVEETLIPQVQGKVAYTLPTGTIGVLKVLRRELTSQGTTGGTSSAGGTVANAFDGDLTTVCTQTSADGNISYDMGSAVFVDHVGICSNGTATYNLIWEYSTDNATWSAALDTASTSYTDNEFTYYSINDPKSARYFRVRETGGATLDVRQIVFGRSPADSEITRQNKDDYYNLADKRSQSDPTLYWYDQQETPKMHVYPAPQSSFKLFSVWHTRHVEDPGDFTNTLAIPQRWLDAVKWELAYRIACHQPTIPIDQKNFLKVQAAETFKINSDDERDRSDLFLAPDISSYTR